MSIYLTRAHELLQIHGLSRTPGRIALLILLAEAPSPVSMEYLQEKLPVNIGQATAYRAMDIFVTEGMVVRFQFVNKRAFYELAHDKPHHHHVICEKCGIVKDIPAHDSAQLTKTTLKDAPDFSKITRHSLEFYGVCKACS